jgi:valyl-tRNA synthetase
MKIGRRLAIKLLNASKFALGSGDASGEVTHPLDIGMLTELAELVDAATLALDDYEYNRALDRTEAFFWSFCDNYLELVKARRYGDHGAAGAHSANRAMQAALSVLLRLFAPYLPFVCEEVWSWWHTGSIHRAPWPAPGEIETLAARDRAAAGCLSVAIAVVGEVRRAKSEAKRPLKAIIARAVVRDTPERLQQVEAARQDLSSAANIQTLVLEPADTFAVEVEFAEAEPVALTPGA